MMQSGKELIVYTSRRKKPNSMRISMCKAACENGHSSMNSFPKKRVSLERKHEKESNEIVKQRGRKKRKQKKLGECDEVTRLQRRARYLLIRIKMENNLLEAYFADGWKGRRIQASTGYLKINFLARHNKSLDPCSIDRSQVLVCVVSREKIRPEKELKRAENEIIKCKISIREIIRELDLSISTCKCGSHGSCMESPEKVPGADDKRLCKYEENKMMIIEAINAHLCTSFSTDSSYVDIFKEEAAEPDSKDLNFKDEQEWPSDESEDEDYNPELNEVPCCSGDETEEMDSDELDLSNSTTYDSNNDEINFGEADEGEIMHRPRQRTNVDYKKLHDEMFGKHAENEEESEDEEWGLHVRKKSRKKANDDRCIVADSTRDANKILNDDVSTHKSKHSRIPPSTVKELQQAFSTNELPSRSVKENLSKQLGLSLKKVDVWFKNARCAALKLRKVSASSCEGTDRKSDEVVLLDASCFIPLSELVQAPKRPGTNNLQRNKASKAKMVQDNILHPEAHFRRCIASSTSFPRSPGKRIHSQNGAGVEHEKVWLDLVRKMCTLQNRIHNLQKTLLLVYSGSCRGTTMKTISQMQHIMYVPFAQLKEKT